MDTVSRDSCAACDGRGFVDDTLDARGIRMEEWCHYCEGGGMVRACEDFSTCGTGNPDTLCAACRYAFDLDQMTQKES